MRPSLTKISDAIELMKQLRGKLIAMAHERHTLSDLADMSEEFILLGDAAGCLECAARQATIRHNRKQRVR